MFRPYYSFGRRRNSPARRGSTRSRHRHSRSPGHGFRGDLFRNSAARDSSADSKDDVKISVAVLGTVLATVYIAAKARWGERGEHGPPRGRSRSRVRHYTTVEGERVIFEGEGRRESRFYHPRRRYRYYETGPTTPRRHSSSDGWCRRRCLSPLGRYAYCAPTWSYRNPSRPNRHRLRRQRDSASHFPTMTGVGYGLGGRGRSRTRPYHSDEEQYTRHNRSFTPRSGSWERTSLGIIPFSFRPRRRWP